MSLREILIAEIETLPETTLPEVIDFVTFLKTRTSYQQHLELNKLQEWEELYLEAAEEDRVLAEIDLIGYVQQLSHEDQK